MVAGGDEAHQSASKEMQDRWKHPLSGMGWYRKAKADFAEPPTTDTCRAALALSDVEHRRAHATDG
jgi:hypothetical protein